MNTTTIAPKLFVHILLVIALYTPSCFSEQDQHLTLKENIALQLYDLGVIKIGNFVLKSGVTSPLYIDFRSIISHPALMKDIAYLCGQKIASLPHHFLCGIAYTALPIATATSVLCDDPMLIVRKEGAKGYGTNKIIEGACKQGDVVLIIEDVITSGSSVQETITKLNAEGLIVNDVVVIVDREQGGRENLMARGYTVHSLFTLSELLELLYKKQKFDASHYETLRSAIKAKL